MKVGDLVVSSEDTSLFAIVGIIAAPERVRGGEWIRVFYPSELGKTFAPVDGIFLIHENHLKVISESR